MIDFIIIGHKAVTTSDYSLNDLPGSAGRMDILCRCVNSALFLSHDLRRDVNIHLILLGSPNPGKIIRFEGEFVRYLSPDERSAGSLIKKALLKLETSINNHSNDESDNFEIRSMPGVFIKSDNLENLLSEFKKDGRNLFYLREDGNSIRETSNLIENPIFILGDHVGITEKEEEMILNFGAKTVSVGPLSLHSDHCITIIHNEMDLKK